MRIFPQILRLAVIFGAVMTSVTLIAAGCGSSEEDALSDVTFDSYFASSASDYNPAYSLEELADQSTVVTRATLVDVEHGRIYAVSDVEPVLDPDKVVPAGIHAHVNLVFETADDTRYYVQVYRPYDSPVDQIRSVIPIGASSVIYLRPNTDPIQTPGDARWFNTREDGNEWWFTTPQGWILEHPEKGIVLPRENTEEWAARFGIPASSTLDDWLPIEEP